jgi:hypothetical protein
MAKKPSTPAELSALAEPALQSSGLTLDDASALHIDILSADQTLALSPSFKRAPSLKFNYIDPWLAQPQKFAPDWPDFYRVRYMGTLTDIASLSTDKPQRYAQPPGPGLCAYFPANINGQWSGILSDSTASIIITEGEKKAACACKHGFPTIGIGGVHNFQIGKMGLVLLPDLEKINWVRRRVYLIFDADFRSNPNVCKAANKLAERLYQRGALVHFVPLPDVVQGGKTGLDDFIITEKNPNALAELINEKAEAMTIAQPLWGLNDQIVYVKNPGMIIVQDTGQKLAPNAFTSHAYANVMASERMLDVNGHISLKDVSAAVKWLQWPFRATVSSITYAPGVPMGITDANEWNTWPGWGCAPKKSKLANLFIKLVDHLFAGTEPEAKKWFLQWCAYPLQHPGVKMFTSAVLFSNTQGVGKSLVFSILGEIYGENYHSIKQVDINGSFNAWAENKQFVLIDDISGTDKRHEADRWKGLITQQKMDINIKYVPTYSVRDCINYGLTSNQPDSIYLENNDRRFFIHEVKVDALPDSFYNEIKAVTKDRGDGTLAPAVFDYLLHIDLTGFNPTAQAFVTQSKLRMIEEVKSDIAAWVSSLVKDPDGVLREGRAEIVGDLFTSKELLNFYHRAGHTLCTAQTIGKELHKAGVPEFQNGTSLRTIKGVGKYYIIRNQGKWMKANPAAATAHVNQIYEKGGWK